jgi:hypothetical protein
MPGPHLPIVVEMAIDPRPLEDLFPETVIGRGMEKDIPVLDGIPILQVILKTNPTPKAIGKPVPPPIGPFIILGLKIDVEEDQNEWNEEGP